MKRARRTRITGQRGFTIVELMIALSILSILLITSTIVLIQIGALYSKGVNSASLQNATRTAAADITAQLQFSGKVAHACVSTNVTCYADNHTYLNGAGQNENVYSYCIGNTRYSYVLNRELGTDTGTTPQQITPHVLWRDTLKGGTSACNALDITQVQPSDSDTVANSGYEMLGSHMRLTRFKVLQATGSPIYVVDVWAAFGDSDLVSTNLSTGSSTCKGGTGTQYCAISTITTQVTGRVY